jgi:hypothetical protein
MLIVPTWAIDLIFRADCSKRFMVDLATSLSFVTAPEMAVLNYRVIHCFKRKI